MIMPADTARRGTGRKCKATVAAAPADDLLGHFMPAGAIPESTTSIATKRYLPWLVAVALFMENLDATIVNTAVPTIAANLNVAPLSLKGVLTSYTLSLAVFIPSADGWRIASAPGASLRSPSPFSWPAPFFAELRSTSRCSWRRASCKAWAAR